MPSKVSSSTRSQRLHRHAFEKALEDIESARRQHDATELAKAAQRLLRAQNQVLTDEIEDALTQGYEEVTLAVGKLLLAAGVAISTNISQDQPRVDPMKAMEAAARAAKQRRPGT